MSQDNTVSFGLVNQTHELLRRVAAGTLDGLTARSGLQALIEGRDFQPLSRTVIITTDGVAITEAFLAQTMTYDGQPLKRHRNGGGWVPAEQDEHDDDRPYVAESVFVTPFAMVLGRAKVFEEVQILDRAQVSGAAEVYGYAVVCGNAWVSGEAEVCDNTLISGIAQVCGEAIVCGSAWISGNVCICNGTISGDTRLGEELDLINA